MEVEFTGINAAADQVTSPRSNHSFPPISQLPIELLVETLKLSLPGSSLGLHSESFISHSQVKRLYALCAVTKHWQGVIEGTPSFWTTIVSTLPPDVNGANILRSSDLPLSVIYYNSRAIKSADHPSGPEFFKLFQHTRPRWSAIYIDVGSHDIVAFSDYLAAPLPLLQTIVVKSGRRQSEPLRLLGGDITNLRFVYLKAVSIRGSVGSFVQLKSLTLEYLARDGLTGDQLMHTIRASPGLQILTLRGIRTRIPTPSPTITLHHLRSINLNYCATDLTECIFRQIRAPSCTKMCLSIHGEQEFDIPHFLNETLKPFHRVLCSIHQRFGKSELWLYPSKFEWETPCHSGMEGFSITIDNAPDPSYICWVDSILQDEPGLLIRVGYTGVFEDAMQRSIAPMRSVTEVCIQVSNNEEDIREALQFIGKSLSTCTSLPSLPYLRELRLLCKNWSTRDLLEMVQSRFCARSWEGMERTPLTIKIDRGYYFRGGAPRSILDLASIGKISSVRCVKLLGWGDLWGTLAVVWDEEDSETV